MVEGIASSVALTERLHYHGQCPNTAGDCNIFSELDNDNKFWNQVTNAIANLCVTLLLTVLIELIIFGDDMLNRNDFMEKVRNRLSNS